MIFNGNNSSQAFVMNIKEKEIRKYDKIQASADCFYENPYLIRDTIYWIGHNNQYEFQLEIEKFSVYQ